MFYCMGIISDSSFDPKFDGYVQMKLTLIYLHIQTYIRFVILTNNNSSNRSNPQKRNDETYNYLVANYTVRLIFLIKFNVKQYVKQSNWETIFHISGINEN